MTAIQCGDEWLLDYSDGALAADLLPQAERHLSTCPRCRQELASLQRSGAMLRGYFDDATSPVPVLVQRTPRRLLVAASSAAAIAAAVLLGAFIISRIPAAIDRSAETVAAVKPVSPAVSAPAEDVLAEVERETQIARLRAASEILAREPGMTERHIALEKYLAESYGVN